MLIERNITALNHILKEHTKNTIITMDM